MNDFMVSFEYERLLEVAREYHEKGYDIILHPGQAELPEFLANHQPDLIARGPDETVVVEVRSRDSLIRSRELTPLAEILADRPGWRLELVVTNPTGRKPGVYPYKSLSFADIRTKLQEVEKLLASGSLEATLLVCWAAAEAIIRLTAVEQDVNLEQLSPLSALKTTFSLGILSRADYKVLERAYELRSRVAHGYRVGDGRNEITVHFLEQLIQVVRRMLRESDRRHQYSHLWASEHAVQTLLATFPNMVVRYTARDTTVGTGHYVWVYMRRLVRRGELRIRFAVPPGSKVTRKVARQLLGVRARVVKLKGKGERLELFLINERQITESGLESLLPELYQEFLRLPGRDQDPFPVAATRSRPAARKIRG
jgi:hypothetical protein